MEKSAALSFYLGAKNSAAFMEVIIMLDKFKIRVIIAVWEYHIAMYTWWDKHQKNAYKHTMWRWHMWRSIECGKKAWTLIGKMYCQ